MAQECAETKDGLTVWEDHFFPEIIDPDTGRALADGEAGELVLTSLSKEGMPVIRYRTRDLTRLLPGTARAMRRIERVKGRSDDMLIIRGVNVFPSQIESVLGREDQLAPHYLIEVRRAKASGRGPAIEMEDPHPTGPLDLVQPEPASSPQSNGAAREVESTKPAG